MEDASPSYSCQYQVIEGYILENNLLPPLHVYFEAAPQISTSLMNIPVVSTCVGRPVAEALLPLVGPPENKNSVLTFTPNLKSSSEQGNWISSIVTSIWGRNCPVARYRSRMKQLHMVLRLISRSMQASGPDKGVRFNLTSSLFASATSFGSLLIVSTSSSSAHKPIAKARLVIRQICHWSREDTLHLPRSAPNRYPGTQTFSHSPLVKS